MAFAGEEFSPGLSEAGYNDSRTAADGTACRPYLQI